MEFRRVLFRAEEALVWWAFLNVEIQKGVCNSVGVKLLYEVAEYGIGGIVVGARGAWVRIHGYGHPCLLRLCYATTDVSGIAVASLPCLVVGGELGRAS